MWIPEATGMGNLTTALWNKGRGSIEIVVHVQYVQIGRSANGANAMIKYAPTYNIRYGRDVQKFIHHLRNCNLGKLYCHAPKIRIERNLWWILIFKSRNDPFWPLHLAACKRVGIKGLDNKYYWNVDVLSKNNCKSFFLLQDWVNVIIGKIAMASLVNSWVPITFKFPQCLNMSVSISLYLSKSLLWMWRCSQ